MPQICFLYFMLPENRKNVWAITVHSVVLAHLVLGRIVAWVGSLDPELCDESWVSDTLFLEDLFGGMPPVGSFQHGRQEPPVSLSLVLSARGHRVSDVAENLCSNENILQKDFSPMVQSESILLTLSKQIKVEKLGVFNEWMMETNFAQKMASVEVKIHLETHFKAVQISIHYQSNDKSWSIPWEQTKL